MKILLRTIAALLCVAGLAGAPAVLAQTTPAAAAASPEDSPGTRYSDKGADTCLECHDADADTPHFTNALVFKSRHAQRGDARTPFGKGGLQCEACHGPGARHGEKGAKRVLTINSQKPNSFMTPEQRNEPCLSCHQNRSRTGWHAGAHGSAKLACADCHQMHVARDPVLAKRTEPEVCAKCHTQQRADFRKPSTHPLKSGRMACSDCHASHGATNVALLARPTLNQTCTTCHADKRGPLLWEHAPVVEDCSLCHKSHGSVRPALLARSGPQLCQQCHSAAGHPAVARSGQALPGNGGTGALFVVAGNCTNCHSQVHGSNHPAGAKLMR